MIVYAIGRWFSYTIKYSEYCHLSCLDDGIKKLQNLKISTKLNTVGKVFIFLTYIWCGGAGCSSIWQFNLKFDSNNANFNEYSCFLKPVQLWTLDEYEGVSRTGSWEKRKQDHWISQIETQYVHILYICSF